MQLLVITGPTASGKSSLALEKAVQLNGEIISVDSMQLYRGIEIGTAQPTVEERAAVPHHLVGIYDFSVRAEVFTFCSLADAAIRDIQSRGKYGSCQSNNSCAPHFRRAIVHNSVKMPVACRNNK